MLSCFVDVCAASIPASLLGALAELRATIGVRALLKPPLVWLRWPVGSEDAVRVVLPLRGSVVYVQRDGTWYRQDSALPAFDVPAEDRFQPLSSMLFPEPIQPVQPPSLSDAAWEKVAAELVRDGTPRPTTALLVAMRHLLTWVDTVPDVRLRGLRGALCGEDVLLVGTRLPALKQSRRFWGERMLRPLGFRLEPDLPESAVRQAAQVADQDLLIMQEAMVDIVPGSSLWQLSRASIRRAAEGVP